jgi:hypothetical protein
MRSFTAVWLGAAAVLAGNAIGQNYRRPVDTAVAPAPQFAPGDPRLAPARQNRPVAWNGMEGPAYPYGYALNLPADGNWRWVEERCHDSAQGTVCVQGHWVRRVQGRCEEVSAHQIRRGNYIRMVPAGPVAGCRG